MLDNLNFWEIGALLLLALFIFGPERLPKVIGDGVRMLRQLREMARNASTDLSRELGTDVQIEDLHPKTFLRKHLLSEEDEAALRRPLDAAYRDLREVSGGLSGEPPTNGPSRGSGDTAHGGGAPAQRTGSQPAFDPDAT